MESIPQKVIDSLENSQKNFVLSAGVDPNDGSLCFINRSLDVKFIKPNGRLKPDFCRPSHDGTGVEVIFFEETLSKFIDVDNLESAAESCMSKSMLFLNDSYVCDVEIAENNT